jgi:hypothetical protein
MDTDRLRSVRCRGCQERFYDVEIDRNGYCEDCAECMKRIKNNKVKGCKNDNGKHGDDNNV